MIVVFALLVAGVLQAQDTPVTGARVTLERRADSVLRVTIENDRDSALVEWQVSIGYGSHTSRQIIAPRQRATVTMSTGGTLSKIPRLTVAAFADGYYEGTGPNFETWLADRKQYVEQLGFWVRAFMDGPKVSAIDLRKYLADRLAESATFRRPSFGGSPRVTADVQRLLNDYPEGPDIWMPYERLRTEAEAQFLEASRQALPHSGAVETVTAATIVSSEPAETSKYVEVVENVSRKPIEAIRISYVDRITGRERGSMTSDYCGSDPDDRTPGHGSIKPGERRERPSSFPADVESGDTRVTFVLYDDLSFDGSQTQRDELLHGREEQGAEYAFAIAAVEETAGKPPSQVEAFVNAKIVERRRQVIASGKQPRMNPLEMMLNELRRSPEHFVATAKVRAEGMERQRLRLIRHLTQPRG